MKIYKHEDYDDYVSAQTIENKQKLDRVWVEDEVIVHLSKYIRKEIKNPNFGICHGSRNGYEVKRFRELLEIKVIGTEISDTASKFDHIIQWDFHDTQSEWIDNTNFIYSNAFCYSNRPAFCLEQWMRCIKKDGFCIIEWTWHHSEKRGNDKAHCFVASKEEYAEIFLKEFDIKDILEFSTEKSKERESCWFIIKHRG